MNASHTRADRPDRRPDLEKLQGEWEWDSEEGVKVAAICGGRIRWRVGEADECEQPFRLGPTKSPKWIDLEVRRGGEVYTSLGIYALEGDTLTIRQSGVDRP